MSELDLELGAIANSLPPQCVDAEEALLGGVLLDKNALERIFDILHPDAFYINSHKLIYQAVLALERASKPIDLMTVLIHLRDVGALDQVGGQTKLVSLVEDTVSAVNIDRYAELVMDKYRRRQLIEAGNEIVQLGHQVATDTNVVVDEAADKIFRIQENNVNLYKLEDSSDMAVPLFEAIEQGKNAGLPTGWTDLDELTGGLHRKTITIIGADSHMGKTSFMIGKAHTVLMTGAPVLFFSCEMSKEQLNPRMLARLSGIDSSRLTKGNKPGGVKDEEWVAISEAIGTFATLPWMVYDEPSPTISTIRSVIKQAIRRHGALGAVFLDYIQLLRIVGSQNRVQELGELTRMLRNCAKDFDFPLFVGSQVNREVGKRNDKRPTKNDFRDSGEIGEAADLCLCLYRDAHYSKNPNDKAIEIIVDKNRPYGRLGTAKMLVDLETCHFMQIDNRDRATVQEVEEGW